MEATTMDPLFKMDEFAKMWNSLRSIIATATSEKDGVLWSHSDYVAIVNQITDESFVRAIKDRSKWRPDRGGWVWFASLKSDHLIRDAVASEA
jgi:hypothetical protein